ncbi:unnamed protein product [Ceratitis capitata]|uniref:(Mediterranean fruit fly) hypothetical protein n=1 Tax=Ceratitis capitata TaxID=7213 RepID=A0A811UMA4_CERCA|nr:unnamed protein product [Ceratitis capitata]
MANNIEAFGTAESWLLLVPKVPRLNLNWTNGNRFERTLLESLNDASNLENFHMSKFNHLQLSITSSLRVELLFTPSRDYLPAFRCFELILSSPLWSVLSHTTQPYRKLESTPQPTADHTIISCTAGTCCWQRKRLAEATELLFLAMHMHTGIHLVNVYNMLGGVPICVLGSRKLITPHRL